MHANLGTPLAILSSGIVSSVGANTAATCAALRANIANPSESCFIGADGELLACHAAPLSHAWRGLPRLAAMAAMAVEECLSAVSPAEWSQIPLLLCAAEPTRPGRIEGIDDALIPSVCDIVQARFAAQSLVISRGRVGVGVALLHARKLLSETNAPGVLIVGADSFVRWPTLGPLQEQDRLLNDYNSNGFLPGEAAAGIYVGRVTDHVHARICGLGFGTELAGLETGEPLRGEGLTKAIRAALDEAGCELHEVDFRISDVSGEQYYFKEATLAVSRLLRRRKEVFDLWHPAECVGETGSAIGPLMFAVAITALIKGYAPGPAVLVHASNDAGQRMAAVVRYGSN
jgi:3-oxoacyl-[acyl-carrier-protein] synthase I